MKVIRKINLKLIKGNELSFSLKCYHFVLLFFLASLILSCSKSDDQTTAKECSPNDNKIVIGIWGSPEFISTSNNCYLEECIEISLKFDNDSTYQLDYIIKDSESDSLLREFHDVGKYKFTCQEVGNFSGRYSNFEFIKGDISFESDSLPLIRWDIEWNQLEGLIIYPEYLEFSHNAYIKLSK